METVDAVHAGGRYDPPGAAAPYIGCRLLIDRCNVVLFPERLGTSYARYDPDGDIATTHPTITDAIRRLMELPSLQAANVHYSA